MLKTIKMTVLLLFMISLLFIPCITKDTTRKAKEELNNSISPSKIQFTKIEDYEREKFGDDQTLNTAAINSIMNELRATVAEFTLAKNYMIIKQTPPPESFDINIILQFTIDPTPFKDIVKANEIEMTCEPKVNDLECSVTISNNPLKLFNIKIQPPDSSVYSKPFYVYMINPFDVNKECQLKEESGKYQDVQFKIKKPNTVADTLTAVLSHESVSGTSYTGVKTYEDSQKTIVFTFKISMAEPGTYLLEIPLENFQPPYRVTLLKRKRIEAIDPIIPFVGQLTTFRIDFTEETIIDKDLMDAVFTDINTSTHKVVLNCGLNGAFSLSCQGDFNGWSANQIGRLSWLNVCGIKTTHNTSIKLVANALNSVIPLIIKLVPGASVTLTYQNIASNLKEIILINKETNRRSPYSVRPSSTVDLVFSIPTTIESGLYTIESKLTDNTIISSLLNASLLIYLQDMALKVGTEIKRASANSLLSQLNVEFESDLFLDRINVITYQKGNEQPKDLPSNQYTVNKATKILRISLGNTFKVDDTYVYKIFDDASTSTPAPSVTYTLQSINFPTTVVFTPSFYFQSAIKIEFEIEIEPTDFTIKSKDGKFLFDHALDSSQSNKKLYTITLKPPLSGAVYGKKDMEFRTFDNQIFMNPNPSLIIINDSTYPKTILTPVITQNILDEYVYIRLREQLYENYIKSFTFNKSNGGNCYLVKSNEQKQRLELDCSPYSIETYTLTMTFDGKAISGSVLLNFVDKCPPGTTKTGMGNCELISSENPVSNCNSYCVHENTSSCSIVNYQPICLCKATFYGLTCEVLKALLVDAVDKSFEKVYIKDEQSYINNAETLSNMLSLKHLLKTAQDDNIVDQLDLTLDRVKPRLENSDVFSLEYLKFIDLAVNILKLKLRKLRPFRLLSFFEDERVSNTPIDDIIRTINDILDANKKFLIEKYYPQRVNNPKCFIEGNENLFCSAFANSISSYDEYLDLNKKAKHSYSDVSKALRSGTYTVIQTELSSELHSLMINNEKSSSKIYLIILDGSGNEITSFDRGSQFLYSYSPNNIENVDEYAYYYDRDIDIYNPHSQAYNTLCYTNQALGYDLSQYYRKYKLFRNMTIIPDNHKCEYKGLDTTSNTILINCPAGIDPGSSSGFSLKDYKLSDISPLTQNIPINCASYVKRIHENIAFWLYLVFTIVFIIISIIIAALRGCGVIQYKQIQTLEKECIELQILDEEIPLSNIRFDEGVKQTFYNNKLEQNLVLEETFSRLFCQNLLTLHPVLSLCQESVLSPINFKFGFFIFNLFIQYGFLAVYYFETIIDNMKDRRNRFEFGYTVRYDFDRVVYAILTSILFTIVIRCIILITLADKGELVAQVDSSRDLESKYQKCDAFSRKMLGRRIIASLLMVGLSIFFWVYCVVFCGIYLNTQFVWFYSCIWIMFFNWLMFIPFTILILSGIEFNTECRTCAYYFKQVFIF